MLGNIVVHAALVIASLSYIQVPKGLGAMIDHELE